MIIIIGPSKDKIYIKRKKKVEIITISIEILSMRRNLKAEI
jgi:hypothetical protein